MIFNKAKSFAEFFNTDFFIQKKMLTLKGKEKQDA